MIRSMTGYARVQATISGREVALEIRSVNGKGCDVKFSARGRLYELEIPMIRAVRSGVQRGSLRVQLEVSQAADGDARLQVDRKMLATWLKTGRELATEHKLDFRPDVKDLLRLPGVVQTEDMGDAGLTWEQVEPLLKRALKELDGSRRKEGTALDRDLRGRLKTIERLTGDIEKLENRRTLDYKGRLLERIQPLLGELPVDAERVEKELAWYSDRVDVSEELTRIRSHIPAFRDTLKGGGTIGKALDFRCQELLREFNTISNKCNDVEISHCTIAARGELEKVREQVQNVE